MYDDTKCSEVCKIKISFVYFPVTLFVRLDGVKWVLNAL